MRKIGILAAALLAGALPASSMAAQQEDGKVVRPAFLIHIVRNLEQSLAFYRDGVNLPVIQGPAPLTASSLVHNAVAQNKAAKARSAILDVPGSALDLQLIEFTGIEGRAFSQRLYDPGVTRFSISTRDIYRAFNQVKDWPGVITDTTSAGPVFTQRPRNNTQAVMLRDPDGFVFEFIQADPLPNETPGVPATSNIYDARSSLAVENLERTVQFYREVLGFATRDTPPNLINDAVLALEGTPRARARNTAVTPPGSRNVWFVWEFSDIIMTKHAPRVQDPGASALSFEVENLAALVRKAKAAGVIIETPGGEPVSLGNGRRGILMRNPDGLLIELVE